MLNPPLPPGSAGGGRSPRFPAQIPSIPSSPKSILSFSLKSLFSREPWNGDRAACFAAGSRLRRAAGREVRRRGGGEGTVAIARTDAANLAGDALRLDDTREPAERSSACPMVYEEILKHVLSLSYVELQCLCRKHDLPTNKSHTQLARSIATMLEASGAKTPAPLSNVKEAATCSQVKNKRVTYSGRDDDRPLLHAKHHKGLQTAVDGTSKGQGMNTSMGISPVSINYGSPDCRGRTSSGPGDAHNVQSQSAVGIANKPANPELASKHDDSPATLQKCSVLDKVCVSSDKTSSSAAPIQFFVVSDEGLNLVVDLNSTPSAVAENFRAQVHIPPRSEYGNVSSFISSSLASKDVHSTIAPSGNIIVDIQSKGNESIAPSTNSSLGSDVGGSSRSELPCPADTTTVNSVSSASTLPGTEFSGYQEGAPVVSSSCLTTDIQNNMTSDLKPGAVDNEVLAPESAYVLQRPERITAPQVDTSVQPTGNKDMVSHGKTKVSGKTGCTKNVLIGDTGNVSTYSLGHVVRSDSNEDSCAKSAGKHTVDVPAGVQVAHKGDIHEVLMENEPMEETGCGDRMSISCQLAGQTVTKQQVTDAQSDASSADHCANGIFDLTNPTSSSAASCKWGKREGKLVNVDFGSWQSLRAPQPAFSPATADCLFLDNAVNPLTSKCGAESVQSPDSADKKRVCDPEELEELESKTPPAYGEPTRNILLSLRSASARQKKPRRSARLVPK
ncbi:hypothetical protein ACP4OV_023405 [Aristida adscensionis]